MRKGFAVICLSGLCLSACAGGAGGASTTARTTASAGTVPPPRILRGNGLESVIGKQATALTQRFGEARIDLSEGDARKLQFISETCVLDIFLYPLQPRSQPVATHIEARRRVGGESADRARCISEVERSSRSGG
ncbi:hypothetical protein EH31_12210 [Erythrobacter longus]|uniref:Lipoprotein n=1 Tax=Erythrobacter longus TaxID=1044 RepID=A0A074MC27_ERYLO|nr:hypothetical protein [Erythrobacter longus]KEO89403.1 hypothetical protein EH31_12210 [Erythrobacter longus]